MALFEQRLQRRRIGKEQLKDHDRADAERQIPVSEIRLEGQRAAEQVEAVQQIEHPTDADGIAVVCPSSLSTHMPRLAERG
jgi:hypothetical protein